MDPRRIAAAALLAGTGLLAYATLVEPRWLQLRRSRVHVRRLPPVLEGLRIGLLTDLHAGGWTPRSVVDRSVRLLMEQAPDLIAVTGDLMDDRNRDFAGVFRVLDALSAPLGVYAVPGNHDHIVGIEAWRRALAEHTSIRDLTNDHVVIDCRGARFCVAGVDDFYHGKPLLELPSPRDRDFTLLLAHSPDQAERVRRAADAIDLTIGGHTHGGQVRLPFLGAIRSSSHNPDLYDEGLRRRPWTQVYTSRGVGTVHLPVRFLARPEVALLHLTAEPRPRRPAPLDRLLHPWRTVTASAQRGG
jgi:uncharacterized protein